MQQVHGVRQHKNEVEIKNLKEIITKNKEKENQNVWVDASTKVQSNDVQLSICAPSVKIRYTFIKLLVQIQTLCVQLQQEEFICIREVM